MDYDDNKLFLQTIHWVRGEHGWANVFKKHKTTCGSLTLNVILFFLSRNQKSKLNWRQSENPIQSIRSKTCYRLGILFNGQLQLFTINKKSSIYRKYRVTIPKRHNNNWSQVRPTNQLAPKSCNKWDLSLKQVPHIAAFWGLANFDLSGYARSYICSISCRVYISFSF